MYMYMCDIDMIVSDDTHDNNYGMMKPDILSQRRAMGLLPLAPGMGLHW